MKIKAMKQYHYTLVRTDFKKIATLPNAGEDMGKFDFSYVPTENIK